MSEKSLSSEEIEATLTLRDRINFPYLIAKQIETFQQAILNMDLSEDEIGEAIEGLIHMIPKSWKDDEFNKGVEKAVTKSSIDIRPSYCGIRASIKFCIDNGIPVSAESEDRDYYALFQTCIDLFDRRGLLSKYVYTEIMTGKRAKRSEPDLTGGEKEDAKT